MGRKAKGVTQVKCTLCGKMVDDLKAHKCPGDPAQCEDCGKELAEGEEYYCAACKAERDAKAKEMSESYRVRLAAVSRMKEMTDTEAWKEFYQRVKRIAIEGAESLVTAEKKDIDHLQARVQLARELMTWPTIATGDLNGYVDDNAGKTPLFSETAPYKASWDAAAGTIELVANEPVEVDKDTLPEVGDEPDDHEEDAKKDE